MSDFTQAEQLNFRSLLDSLRGREASLEALINMADGNPFAPFEWDWLGDALQRRGLIEMHWSSYDPEVGMYTDPNDKFTGWCFTDLGKRFVAWLREPRELPSQMELPL